MTGENDAPTLCIELRPHPQAHLVGLPAKQLRVTPTPRSNPTLFNPQIRTGIMGVWRCAMATGAAIANPAIPPTNAPRRSSAKSHCSFVSTRTAANTPRTPPTRAPPNSPGFPAPLPKADPITAPRPASAQVAMNTGMGFKGVPPPNESPQAAGGEPVDAREVGMRSDADWPWLAPDSFMFSS